MSSWSEHEIINPLARLLNWLTDRLIWLSEHTINGVMAIALVSYGLRCRNMDGTADILFDEVYNPKFAQNYHKKEQYFDDHTP